MKMKTTNHIQSLDGLRGSCALMVALMHMQVFTHIYSLSIIRNAWMFVDFFFVLSGFVISFAYADRLSSKRGILIFAVRRFGRLWPLHASVLMMLIALEVVRYILSKYSGVETTRTPFTGQFSVSSIFQNLFLLHALWIHNIATWNGASWSISTEYYTYLIFALLCLFLTKPRMRLIAWMISISSLIVIVMCVPTYMQTEGQIIVDGKILPTSDFTMFRCLYSFYAGVITYDYWKRRQIENRRALSLTEGAIVLLVVLFVSFSGKNITSVLATPVFMATVYIFAHGAGPLSKLLQSRPMVCLGSWSYSIYMVHTIVFSFTTKEQSAHIVDRVFHIHAWNSVIVDGNPAEMISFTSIWYNDLYALFVVACVLFVSYLSHTYIEIPGQRAFGHLAKRCIG